jgi:type VI secretion system protein VasG
MLTVEPRALLKKLNPACASAFEAAAANCVGARHYEVTVEHVALALLDVSGGDFATILAHFGVDAERMRQPLARAISDMRGGNVGKPVFSSRLFEWLQDSWLYASAELGSSLVRSGALFVRLLAAPTRYLPFELPALEEIPRDEVRQELMRLAAKSVEAGTDAAPVGGQSVAGAPAAGGPGRDGALARFTTDVTQQFRDGKLDPVFGREREVRQMIEILVRRRKNNPIIVGEPGVGKTALVEGLAQRIVEGSVPEQLAKVRILSLDLGALQAGAGVRGEFENRLKGVIDAVKASAEPIILFIDEAHTIIGAGGPQGGGDAANLLKPALARGELRTIAATTYAEFKRYFEKDAALERRFQPVRVDEPSQENAVLMLRGVATRFEKAHGVIIRDEAVRAAVALSSRYISGRQLPDKAVDVLDTAGAYVNLVRKAPPAEIDDTRALLEAVERELAAFARDERAGVTGDSTTHEAATLRRDALLERAHLLEERAKKQRDLVARIDALREAGSDVAALKAALDELRSIPAEERLVAADVDEAVVSAVVSSWTGIPLGKMVRDDLRAALELEDRLRERVRGQEAAISVLSRELRAARSGLKPENAPLGVFLLVGPSGVGKTETALALAEQMFGGERFVVTINMSEFQERHTVSRLIGSPPGYVGFGEGGVLTEAVRHKPYSLVLLDEVEKADREVMNLFYQVFDKGTLSDGEGRVIDFSNTVIVMTSNLATDLLTEAAAPDRPLPDHDELVALVKPTLSSWFKPALLARMTVVPFVPIRGDVLEQIVTMKLGSLSKRVQRSHGVALRVEPTVVTEIAARCREVESGARNVDHILRGQVMPAVSSKILGTLADGGALGDLTVSLADDGSIRCN